MLSGLPWLRHWTTFPRRSVGADQRCDRRTLQRRFHTFWLIDIPCSPDPYRIHDQVFIDATYTAADCLLIASTLDHVLCWHWDRRETTAAYTALLKQLAPPLCVVLDSGQGAYSAIKTCWPKTKIQRCLVHAQRVIRRYITSRPPYRCRQSDLRPCPETDHHHNC